MKGLYVNDELERTWKEAIVAYFKVLPRHPAGGTEENLENLSQCIRSLGRDFTRELPNTKQECSMP
jgi:hypothetical protein